MKTIDKNIRIGIRALMVALCASLFSCSDFFDPSQDLVQEKEDHYNSLDKVRRATIGAYAKLQDLVESLVVMGDLRSELMTVTYNYDAHLEEIDLHKISDDNPYADPRPFYDVILNCNDLLTNIERSYADPQMTENKQQAFKAEIRTLRAWVYFQMIQRYKTVPVLKEAVDGHFPDYQPREYNMVDMVNWLIKETEWAMEQPFLDWKLFDKDGKEVSQPWRLTRINRRALLGELYLSSGNYQKAADLFYDCIIVDGGGADELRLKCSEPTGRSKWKDLWKAVTLDDHASSLGHLTAVPFDKSKHQTNNLLSLFSNATVNKYLLKPTARSVANWEGQELKGTTFLNRDIYRGFGASYSVFNQDTIVMKYLTGKSTYRDDAVYPIYRAADLHLLYAEAINRAGKPEVALEVINESLEGSPETAGIRGRVSLQPLDLLDLRDKYPHLSSDIEIVEMALLEERALEFAFEGRRWNDLVRFATRAGKPEWLAETVAQKYKGIDDKKADELRSKLMTPSNWKLEIQTENSDN
ncbi:hypothetical protein FUAX_23920 [Fulvitalea axinellae]|uniref:RagB/SusD domain-containing protein n=1 Tax=Fulvitalea axinellae TaxID=1182444 RepID=A0AAU9DC36_9BACT|nr:hypothetical protein FUAX_23920 [Fulvitalea axinellae]